MAKYTFEFKKQIVMDYINGGGGTQFLAKNMVFPIILNFNAGQHLIKNLEMLD